MKKGVYQAGGMPVEMPVRSFSEQFLKPTSMLYPNMGTLEVEETLRSYPIDRAVLLGGCDKSKTALVMGAGSMGLPFIFLPAGAMLGGAVALMTGRPALRIDLIRLLDRRIIASQRAAIAPPASPPAFICLSRKGCAGRDLPPP